MSKNIQIKNTFYLMISILQFLRMMFLLMVKHGNAAEVVELQIWT
ncbi:MAG: hypothetical protein R3C11_06155 [Planctomycetaceae bacterium]